MAEYIDRDAAIELLHYNADETCSAVVSDFESIPAADVAPVVHGRWRFCGTDRWNDCYECSQCGSAAMDNSDFCPYCGARMME